MNASIENLKNINKVKFLNNSLPEPGQYWTELETNIVLLISKIKYIDGFPHTIILKGHPTKEHSYGQEIIYTEFINKYKYCFEGKEIREKEIKELNEKIFSNQSKLSKLMDEPLDSPVFKNFSNEHNLPVAYSKILNNEELTTLGAIANSTEGIMNVLNKGNLTTDYLHDMQARTNNHLSATIAKSNMIDSVNKEIFDDMENLGRLFKEKVTMELARTQHVQEKIDVLNTGLTTLSLYLGENVVLTKLKEGNRSIGKKPIYLFQDKRYIDEEIAVFTDFDDGSFDFQNEKEFYEILKKNPEFLESLIPAEKGLVVVSWRRYSKEYNDNLYNIINNEENKRSWLLFRDGENIWAIDSPINSHNHALTLFSTKQEMERIFKSWDGKEITYNNTKYVDALKKEENAFLHYKRFAILLSGLHDRVNLLGDLPVDAHNGKLFLPEVQEQVYVFVYDAEKDFMLGTGLLPINDFIENKNKYLKKGSKVAVWNLSEDSIPGAYSSNNNMVYSPVDKVSVGLALLKNNNLILPIHSQHRWNDSYRNISCFLDTLDNNKLCLDMISLKEIHDYIHDRSHRNNYKTFFPLFKKIKSIIKEDELFLCDIYSYFEILFTKIGLTVSTEKLREAMALWRTSHHYDLPPQISSSEFHDFEKEYCDIIYSLVGHGRNLVNEINELLKNIGRTPIRLVVNGKNKHFIYTELNNNERLPINSSVNWVAKNKLIINKNSIALDKNTSYTTILENNAMEKILYDWTNISSNLSLNIPNFKKNDIDEIYNISNEWEKKFNKVFKWKNKDDNDFEEYLLKKYQHEINILKEKRDSYIHDIVRRIPIGFIEWDKKTLGIIYLNILNIVSFFNGSEERKKIIKNYCNQISNSYFDGIVKKDEFFGFTIDEYNKNWLKDITTTFNGFGAKNLGYQYKTTTNRGENINSFEDYVKKILLRNPDRLTNIWVIDDIDYLLSTITEKL